MFDSAPGRFFLDPWASEYGSALEAEPEDEDDPDAEPPEYVEPSDWLMPITPEAVPSPGSVVFVDGVQRFDAFGRLFAGDRLVQAALASLAVGAVLWREDLAEFAADHRIERVLAVTESASAGPMAIHAGHTELVYLPKSHREKGAAGLKLAVKERRSEIERQYAETMVGQDKLVVLDGRLSFDPGAAAPVVGFIKTIQRFYVDSERLSLLPQLGAGQRSPVFRIRYGETTRYSWFLRLPHTQEIHHPFAGLVRLETPEVGETTALSLANLTSYLLPSFASLPEHDPRAPQNLIPIGALEHHLRHELGDSLFIRRAIEDYLYEAPE